MTIKAVLMDIEDTTTDSHFIRQVLLPYARQQMPRYLKQHSAEPEVAAIIAKVKKQLPNHAGLTQVISYLQQLNDEHSKLPELKTLQGLIWQGGYYDGELKGHLFPDILGQLMRWHEQQILIALFSCASVKAQQLLFGYSQYGDISPLISHYFDGDTGKKQAHQSYQRITQLMKLDKQQILFISAQAAELDAAKSAGMNTLLIERTEPVDHNNRLASYSRVKGFNQIKLESFS